MKNIAVLINGSSKYLDLTYNLFEHWNKLYDDINFDFYLSTWEDSIDYSNFKWITKYERLKEDECPYNLKKHPPRRHQPHYSYTLYRVNQLKNSTGKDYDSIIQTRSDYLFSRELLDCLVSLTKGKLFESMYLKHKDAKQNLFHLSIISAGASTGSNPFVCLCITLFP